MKKIGKLSGGLAIFVVCISSLANAQARDFSGTWTGKAVCPIGSVEFTMEIQGENGTFTYGGYGPQKLYATKFPINVTYMQKEMYVHFAGLNQGANFGSFQGTLLADGTVGNVYGLKVNNGYCKEFSLSRGKVGDRSRVSKEAPSFNAKGLANEPLLTKLMQGSFATINVPTDHILFNSLYGSYLSSYARKCAANPKTRPKNFVEMTNLQCGDERITATYYSNGMYTESAPYCTRWKDVPNGLYADPKMWEVKKKLDAAFLGDTYKNIFAFLKKLDKPDIYEGVFEASSQRMLAAITTITKDMDALVKMNACNSPGLMRFQENLRLYAINRPFGIRLDGSSGAPIPIPAPGTTFKDPNYETLLEDMVKGEARSWQTNKYLLKSVANPSVISRDSQGRPLSVAAGYRFGGMGGMAAGSVTLTFYEGYPECLYFFDKPNSCRSPNKEVTARYVHGGYSLQPPLTLEEKRLAKEKEAKESEERMKNRQKRQELRQR